MKINFTNGFILLFACIMLSVQSSEKKNRKYIIKVLNEKYALIPADSTVIYDYLIFKTEVSNINYREFLWELKQRGELDKLKIAMVDSACWVDANTYGQAYMNHYHSHPAYNNYPLVNVTREGAQLYCEWLTEKVNATLGGPGKLVFRLPTHQEWLKAARGTGEEASYSWGSNRLQNTKGNYLCNFIAKGAECVARDSAGRYYVERVDYDHLAYPGNYADVTAPVESYWPNDFGMYNMNGNVAEMIADKDIVAGGSWNDPGYDVRNRSVKRYSGASRTVGFRMVATIVPSEHDWLKLPKRK